MSNDSSAVLLTCEGEWMHLTCVKGGVDGKWEMDVRQMCGRLYPLYIYIFRGGLICEKYNFLESSVWVCYLFDNFWTK